MMTTTRKELLKELLRERKIIQIILIMITEITMVTVKRKTMLQISNKEIKEF